MEPPAREDPSQAADSAFHEAVATAAPAATARAATVGASAGSESAETLDVAPTAFAAEEDPLQGRHPAGYDCPEAAPAGAAITAAPTPTSASTEAGPAVEPRAAAEAEAEAEAAAAPETGAAPSASAATGDEGEEDLFGSEDDGSHETSLGSDVDLFGDEQDPAAAARGAAAAPEAASAADLAEKGEEETAAASAPATLYDDETEDFRRPKDTGKDIADALPPQEMKLPEPWAPNLLPGATILTWKIPPALSLITTTEQKQQQQKQQQQPGLAIKFSYDENAAAQGKPSYTSNCRLVQFSDDSYCLFVDDQAFECNIKDDVSYIFESGGTRDPLCSILASEKRLQVLMRAGLGVDSFFSQSKAAARFEPKTRTAPTATPLVQAAEIADQHAFITRQEAARSRRAQAESQRGLTRGFLEAEDSDLEDEQGASLEKIKERFKRRRFL